MFGDAHHDEGSENADDHEQPNVALSHWFHVQYMSRVEIGSHTRCEECFL